MVDSNKIKWSNERKMATKYHALIVNPWHVVLYKLLTCYIEFLVRISTAKCLMVRTVHKFPTISSSVSQKSRFYFDAGNIIKNRENRFPQEIATCRHETEVLHSDIRGASQKFPFEFQSTFNLFSSASFSRLR